MQAAEDGREFLAVSRFFPHPMPMISESTSVLLAPPAPMVAPTMPRYPDLHQAGPARLRPIGALDSRVRRSQAKFPGHSAGCCTSSAL
jgi:hypothetical protein